ncbi:uncharacterized protein LOC143181180 [Calliopsis andreniformis]|uniref:uncharacterized protein LOC143181180 n=1 Tax=Calliopsis andreniformis TaxID=337506 RepID=UPI003FCD424D
MVLCYKMERKVIDQKEYLKKYLSSGNSDDKKKKKKKKLKVGAKTVKIIDDDIDLKNMRPIDENEFDIFINAEDAPQIAGIVDERGPVDFTDRRRWKIISNDQDGDLTFTSQDVGSKKSKTVCLDDDLSPPRVSKSLEKQKNKSNAREDNGRDNDLSPPRRKSKKHESESDSSTDTEISSHKLKKKMRKKASDSDLSPPRQTKNYDSDISPPRKSKKHKSEKSMKHKNETDSDLSPPRRSRRDSDSDLSPPRKKKNYDSDLSPPRKSKKHKSEKNMKHKNETDSDLSPPRKSRRDSDSDLSPPRKKKNYDSDLSPPRKSKKHRSEKNAHKNESDSDMGPPRKSRKDSDPDLSPPRKKKTKHYDLDLSPPRRHDKHKSSQKDRNNDTDLSPPRKHKHREHKDKRDHKHSDRSSRTDRKHDSGMSPPHRTHRELDSRSREDERDSYKLKKSRWNDVSEYDYRHSHKESSYRKEQSMQDINDNQRTESRHKDDKEGNDKRMKKTLDGKTAGLQNARALREETEAHKKREAEHFNKLSKEVTGVGQAAVVRDTKTGKKRNLEAEAAEEREKQKRQAELDQKYAKWGKGLKQVEDREEKLKDDLYEMSKPLARYADDPDLDKRLKEQEREGDPMLEYIKQKQIKEGKRKPDRPAYGGSYMPNRFGIKPGHRWDGVDRSNGYEKKWFEAQNAKVARQEEAYKWSTSDM